MSTAQNSPVTCAVQLLLFFIPLLGRNWKWDEEAGWGNPIIRKVWPLKTPGERSLTARDDRQPPRKGATARSHSGSERGRCEMGSNVACRKVLRPRKAGLSQPILGSSHRLVTLWGRLIPSRNALNQVPVGQTGVFTLAFQRQAIPLSVTPVSSSLGTLRRKNPAVAVGSITLRTR
jgi:hypothetical protein